MEGANDHIACCIKEDLCGIKHHTLIAWVSAGEEFEHGSAWCSGSGSLQGCCHLKTHLGSTSLSARGSSVAQGWLDWGLQFLADSWWNPSSVLCYNGQCIGQLTTWQLAFWLSSEQASKRGRENRHVRSQNFCDVSSLLPYSVKRKSPGIVHTQVGVLAHKGVLTLLIPGGGITGGHLRSCLQQAVYQDQTLSKTGNVW